MLGAIPDVDRADFGIASHLIYDNGRKANPLHRAGIGLSGHTDVVPVDGQDWHSDPFSVITSQASTCSVS